MKTWEQLIGSWGQVIFFLINLAVIAIVTLVIMTLWKAFKGGVSPGADAWQRFKHGASRLLLSFGAALFVGAIFHQVVYGAFSIKALFIGELGFMRFMMYSVMLIFFGLWITAPKRYRGLYWVTGIGIFVWAAFDTIWLSLPTDQRKEHQLASQRVLAASSDYLLAQQERTGMTIEQRATDQLALNRIPLVYRVKTEAPMLVAKSKVVDTTVVQCQVSGRRFKAATRLFGKSEAQGVCNGLPTIAVLEVGAPTSEWVYAFRHDLIEGEVPPTPVPVKPISAGAAAHAAAVPVVHQSKPVVSLGIQDAEPEILVDDSTFDKVVAKIGEWSESKIVPRDGDAIEFGPFNNKVDVERLMVRRSGRPPVHLEAKSTNNGQWKGRVRIDLHGRPSARQEVRLESGADLTVIIEVVERRKGHDPR